MGPLMYNEKNKMIFKSQSLSSNVFAEIDSWGTVTDHWESFMADPGLPIP